jgi:hypothetical protein
MSARCYRRSAPAGGEAGESEEMREASGLEGRSPRYAAFGQNTFEKT